MEDNLRFQIEDNLNIHVNGRCPLQKSEKNTHTQMVVEPLRVT